MVLLIRFFDFSNDHIKERMLDVFYHWLVVYKGRPSDLAHSVELLKEETISISHGDECDSYLTRLSHNSVCDISFFAGYTSIVTPSTISVVPSVTVS